MKNKCHDLGTYCVFEDTTVSSETQKCKAYSHRNWWVSSLVKKNQIWDSLFFNDCEMKVLNFSPPFLCQRNWESGHTRLGFGVGEQYLAGHIFDHQIHHLWGTWEPTVKTRTAQSLLPRPKGFGQPQQLLCSFLGSWTGSRFGEPEQHRDQPGFSLKIKLESI